MPLHEACGSNGWVLGSGCDHVPHLSAGAWGRVGGLLSLFTDSSGNELAVALGIAITAAFDTIEKHPDAFQRCRWSMTSALSLFKTAVLDAIDEGVAEFVQLARIGRV